MTPTERDGFIKTLLATADLFGRRLGREAADLYANALQDVPYERLILALKRLVRTAETGAKFPLPRDLRRLAGGRAEARDTLGDIKAQLAKAQRRQEWLKAGEPLTPARMVSILRDVMPRANRVLRASWEKLCEDIEQRRPLSRGGGALGEVVRTVVEGPDPESPYWTDQRKDREPGEDG